MFSAIGARLLGMGHLPEQAIDDFVFRQFAGAAIADGRWDGLTVDEILAKVDGKIGPKTIDAVRAFQRASGIAPDGYASLTLLKKLR